MRKIIVVTDCNSCPYRQFTVENGSIISFCQNVITGEDFVLDKRLSTIDERCWLTNAQDYIKNATRESKSMQSSVELSQSANSIGMLNNDDARQLASDDWDRDIPAISSNTSDASTDNTESLPHKEWTYERDPKRKYTVDEEAKRVVKFAYDMYLSQCPTLPKCDIDSLASSKIRLMWMSVEHLHFDNLHTLFHMVATSDFLLGKRSDWKASFCWILGRRGKEYNCDKIMSGKYNNKRRGSAFIDGERNYKEEF